MKEVPTLTYEELARKYCDRQDSTPQTLLETLNAQKGKYQPAGFMLLECQDMCSSLMGSLTILPYGGPANTFKEPPTHPISPRGLASDMSIAIGILPAGDLPAELPESLKSWEPPPPPAKARKKRK